jgi:hypothetical protein
VLAGLAAVVLCAPAPARADSCAGEGDYAADNPAKSERTLLCLTNVHRAANGIHALTMDPILLATARAYSADMANRSFFNHFGGPGCDDAQAAAHTNGCNYPWDRAMAMGFPSDQVGENIARGFLQTPRDIFTGFRNSPGHNANMLGTGYVTGGFGIASAHVTENFSSFANGGTDTAVDLLITTECENARNAVSPLEAQLATAKQRYKKAKKKGKGVSGAKKRFKAAKKKLAAARELEKKQCGPRTSY